MKELYIHSYKPVIGSSFRNAFRLQDGRTLEVEYTPIYTRLRSKKRLRFNKLITMLLHYF